MSIMTTWQRRHVKGNQMIFCAIYSQTPASPYFNMKYELSQAKIRKDIRRDRVKYYGYYMLTGIENLFFREAKLAGKEWKAK